MNIVVKSALASAAFALSYACANPVEIDDVQVVDPNVFGDGGLLGGAGGGTGQGGASQGGTGAGIAGSASGTGGSPSSGIAGMPVGSSGAGGLPVGAAGTGGGGAGVGGASGGGSGGAAGAAAAAGGTAGSAGTGGTGSSAVFTPSSCDFDDTTGCDTLTCQARCPTNDGNSCLNRCVAVLDCVSDNVADNPDTPCVTEADPLCGSRDGGQPRACTTVVEPAGGPNPSPPTGNQAPQPSFVARGFVECICSLPRP